MPPRHSRTFDSLLENVLGFHVEVIGGLIEDQQIDGLKQETDHGQSCLFTAGKDFDFLVGSFASEHEGAEDVADPGADIADGHAVDSVEHGDFSVKQRGLVLGEVADLYVVADFEVSGKRYLAHDTFDKG